MSTLIEGHSIMSKRPDARWRLLWRVETASGTHWRLDGETRLHGSQEDAYDAAGLDPNQTPNSPDREPNGPADDDALADE